MQKVHYEKDIDLSHGLQELKSLTVDENIDYKIEEDGMHAMGSLLIKGEYNEDIKIFVENVDVDIFARKEKIEDQREFMIKVESFDYKINDGNLTVYVEVGIYGVKEGQDHYIEDTIQDIPFKEKVYETKIKEELEENIEEQGVYYLYVVDKHDTYTSISKKYQIDENYLISYNNNTPLQPGVIVVIPYVRTPS